MAKKCKCPPPGAPDWVLTYGDMMSLLLTFFILLAALSELKEEEKYHKIVTEIQASFGAQVGSARIPLPIEARMPIPTDNTEMASTPPKNPSAEDPGVRGPQDQVRTIRDGMIFPHGGRITFEPGSAALNSDAEHVLVALADKFQGLTNMIELRGHASASERSLLTEEDVWDLSYARAKVVMDFLTSDRVGIARARFRITAIAENDPLATRVYTASGQEINRRVEILMSEDIVRSSDPEPSGAR